MVHGGNLAERGLDFHGHACRVFLLRDRFPVASYRDLLIYGNRVDSTVCD